MIIKHLELLQQRRIALASKSPRREQLLSLIGINAAKLPSSFEENLKPKDFPSAADYAVETAKYKALDVAALHGDRFDLLIAADTVVELDGEVLEKPKDETDAVETLMRMSGRQHRVFTGVVLHLPSCGPTTRQFHAATSVWFDDFDEEEAKSYVRTKEPMDKAGSYGIQGYGGTLVKKIDGCYFNVMGLPINLLASNIKDLIDEGLL
eukprot:g514.t1